MPTTIAITAAANASSSVAGKRSLIQRRTALPLAQADAKVALYCVADEVPKLHVKRLIKSKVAAQPRAVLGCRVLPKHLRHRIANVLKQQKSDQRHDQHDENRLQQAAYDKCGHDSILEQAI